MTFLGFLSQPGYFISEHRSFLGDRPIVLTEGGHRILMEDQWRSLRDYLPKEVPEKYFVLNKGQDLILITETGKPLYSTRDLKTWEKLSGSEYVNQDTALPTIINFCGRSISDPNDTNFQATTTEGDCLVLHKNRRIDKTNQLEFSLFDWKTDSYSHLFSLSFECSEYVYIGLAEKRDELIIQCNDSERAKVYSFSKAQKKIEFSREIETFLKTDFRKVGDLFQRKYFLLNNVYYEISAADYLKTEDVFVFGSTKNPTNALGQIWTVGEGALIKLGAFFR